MRDTKRGPGRPPGERFPRRLPFYDDDEEMALLQEMAQQDGCSAVALMRRLIRQEAAQRGLRGDIGSRSPELRPAEAGNAAERVPARPANNGERPVFDLRALAERARGGDREAEAEMKRVIARLQAETVIQEPSRGELSAEEREARRQLYVRLAEEIRAAAPPDLSPEELERAIEPAVAEVREQRRARRDRTDQRPYGVCDTLCAEAEQ